MKITTAWLKKRNACKDGVIWFNEKIGKPIDHMTLLKLGMRAKQYDYANWFICQIMKRKQRIQYAIYSVEQVIDIFEKYYPKDDRPRKAIEAAKAVLKKDSKKNRAAAEAAADAAYAAADAADAAMKKKILEYGIKLLKSGATE